MMAWALVLIILSNGGVAVTVEHFYSKGGCENAGAMISKTVKDTENGGVVSYSCIKEL